MNDDTHSLSPLNPWTSIWTKPRETVQHLIETNPEYMVLPIVALNGIVQALGNASEREPTHSLPFVVLLLIIAFMGPIGGVVSLFIGSGVLSVTGKWIGGKGNSQVIRTAIAWSSIPTMCLLPLWVVMILWLGESLFYSAVFEANLTLSGSVGLILFGITQIVLVIWATVLFFKALAQVQGFSVWRAVGNALLAVVLVAVPITVLAMLLGAMD